MEAILSCLLDNLGYIILAVGVLVSTVFGKPKTVKQLKAKLTKKGEKLSAKLNKVADELEEIEKEG